MEFRRSEVLREDGGERCKACAHVLPQLRYAYTFVRRQEAEYLFAASRLSRPKGRSSTTPTEVVHLGSSMEHRSDPHTPARTAVMTAPEEEADGPHQSLLIQRLSSSRELAPHKHGAYPVATKPN